VLVGWPGHPAYSRGSSKIDVGNITCSRNRQKTPYTTLTPLGFFSKTTWSWSFGKLSGHRRSCARSQRNRALVRLLIDIIVLIALFSFSYCIILLASMPFKWCIDRVHFPHPRQARQWRGCACTRRSSSLLRGHSFSSGVSKYAWAVLGRYRSVSLTSIIFSSWRTQHFRRVRTQAFAKRVFPCRRQAWRLERASKIQSYDFEVILDNSQSRIEYTTTRKWSRNQTKEIDTSRVKIDAFRTACSGAKRLGAQKELR
jgi:hypothetical protein